MTTGTRPMVEIAGMRIPARWLRDHGDDPGSVDPDSLQRVVDTFAIPRDIAVIEARVDAGAATATIRWTDGATTTHRLAGLREVVSHPRAPGPAAGAGNRDALFTVDPATELWSTADRFVDPHRFPAGVIDDDRSWPAALAHLQRFGWVAFDGADPGEGPVRRLAARLGYPRSSIFGDVWTMAAGAQEHKDSAYAPTPLDVHTDGTYSHDAPGTIIFSQQERGGEGGDSVLVDGFAVARDLAARDPAAADLLTRYEITGRYAEPGVHLRADRVPLRLDAAGVLRQVTFNNYDRAPVLPAPDVLDAVLDAYAAFHELASEPSRALHLGWEPGRMLVIDNWRMLHGRTGYTGSRVFIGCYTNHEDLESALRLTPKISLDPTALDPAALDPVALDPPDL